MRGIHRWPVNSPHKWASYVENVSIWWRHRGFALLTLSVVNPPECSKRLRDMSQPCVFMVLTILAPSQYKDNLSRYINFHYKTRRSWDCPILLMGNRIEAIRYLYVETATVLHGWYYLSTPWSEGCCARSGYLRPGQVITSHSIWWYRFRLLGNSIPLHD